MLGSVKEYTSSCHPQTNGMVERLNHTLCQMLAYLIADDQIIGTRFYCTP